MASYILKPKLSRWIESWNNSAVDIGIAILIVSMAVLVCCFLHLSLSLEITRLVDILHAVSYSLLLLNTDLHVAELATHMSKSQFVRNTMAAIRAQPDSASALSASEFTRDDASSVRGGSDETEMPTSKRCDSVASWNSLSPDAALFTTNGTPCDPDQVNSNFNGQESRPHGKAWEAVMESLLKVFIICSFVQLSSSDMCVNRKCTMPSNISRFCNQQRI